MAIPPAPVADREEDRVIYAGVAPPGWDAEKVVRQADTSKEPLLDPPVAISDPYGWMRDESRTEKRVLDHLKAENEYTKSLTQHLESLRETVYQEMIDSIQETDYRTPYVDGPFYYYSRTMKGKSYPIYCRAPKSANISFPIEWDGTPESPILPNEQVLLDVNALAKDKAYCDLGSIRHSPSHNLLAYTADYTGDEVCLMYVKDLDTGEIIHHDPNLAMYGSLTWGADDSTLFYFKLDDSKRPFQLYRRKITTAAEDGQEDELLLEEPDSLFWMGIYKSSDDKYLFVETSSKETTEIHYLDLHDPEAILKCVARRRKKVLYEIDHRKGYWWIQSNVGGLPNKALFLSPAVPDCEEQWTLLKNGEGDKVLFAGDYDRSLDFVSCFANHAIACGREEGLPRVWVLSLSENNVVSNCERLAFAEDAYDVELGVHREFDTNQLMVLYDSMVTPTQSIQINMDDTRQRMVLKEKKVPGYDKPLYGTERTTVLARDGKTQIPISMVYRKDIMDKHMQSGEPAHVHLYGRCLVAWFG